MDLVKQSADLSTREAEGTSTTHSLTLKEAFSQWKKDAGKFYEFNRDATGEAHSHISEAYPEDGSDESVSSDDEKSQSDVEDGQNLPSGRSPLSQTRQLSSSKKSIHEHIERYNYELEELYHLQGVWASMPESEVLGGMLESGRAAMRELRALGSDYRILAKTSNPDQASELASAKSLMRQTWTEACHLFAQRYAIVKGSVLTCDKAKSTAWWQDKLLCDIPFASEIPCDCVTKGDPSSQRSVAVHSEEEKSAEMDRLAELKRRVDDEETKIMETAPWGPRLKTGILS